MTSWGELEIENYSHSFEIEKNKDELVVIMIQ